MTLNIKIFYTRKEYALLEKKMNKAILIAQTLLNSVEDKDVRALFKKAIKEINDIR